MEPRILDATDFEDDGASYRVRQERIKIRRQRGIRHKLATMPLSKLLALVIFGPVLLLFGAAVGVLIVNSIVRLN
jgi:hypothetical protein